MITERARVHPVHAVELRDIDEKHAAAQDVLQTGSGGFQDARDVAQTLFRLALHIGRHLAGSWILADLAGHEDQPFEQDGGRIWTRRFRERVCVHGTV
jgi:hypothetical protein